MTRKDAGIGAKVAHARFPHWGTGEVLAYREKDNLGYPTPCKIQIKWETRDDPVWMRISDLRKPNFRVRR